MINWTTGAKRITAAFAVLVAICLGLALMPWRIENGPMRAEAERRIRIALDAPDAAIGAMSLTLLPTPRLKVKTLSFTRTDGSLSGMAQSATVAIKMDPLVRGIAKPTGLMLTKPTLSVRVPGSGEHLLAQADAVRKSLVDMLVTSESIRGLSEIEIDDGRLHLNGPAGSDTIENLRLTASIASPARPLRVNASGRHNGADMRLSFAGASPRALAGGQSEPINLNISIGGAQIDFRGDGSLASDINIKGLLSVSAADVVKVPYVAALVGVSKETRNFSLRAGLEVIRNAATLRDLSVLTGSMRFDGVGAMRHDGQRWQVNATLATPQLDFTTMAGRLSAIRSQDGGWSSKPFDLERLFGLNLDLRISADRVLLGNHVLTKVGMAMIARQSRLEASISDAVLGGGRARARLIMTRRPDLKLDHKLTATLDGADLGAIATAAGMQARLTGTGNLDAALESSGDSAAQIAANLEGRIGLTARAGDIAGIDLNRLAQRRAARPDLMLADALGGKTAFESAVLNTKISRGQMAPVEGSMQAGRLVGTLSGEIDIAQDDVRLQGSVVQVKAEPGALEPRPVIDFTINGRLNDPRMTPNIAALLKRS